MIVLNALDARIDPRIQHLAKKMVLLTG